MSTRSMLYKNTYTVNNFIDIKIPTVGEVIDNEDVYYNLISVLTAMPIDMMVQLDDIGIDFTQITEYELFILMFETIKTQDVSLVFNNLDLKKFKLAEDKNTGAVVLTDGTNIIDHNTHTQISGVLRLIHHLEKDKRKPANKEAKEFMLRRARDKIKRARRKTQPSQIEGLIIAMVNTEQYKYDFEGTRELSIYQFNESVRQIINKVDYDNRMIGVYTGNINTKELSQQDFNWLIPK